VNPLPPPLRSQAGLRGVGRGPAGGRASDAAIVALHVLGGLIVAAVSLCLRISKIVPHQPDDSDRVGFTGSDELELST
jgi:hypothetical protein